MTAELLSVLCINRSGRSQSDERQPAFLLAGLCARHLLSSACGLLPYEKHGLSWPEPKPLHGPARNTCARTDTSLFPRHTMPSSKPFQWRDLSLALRLPLDVFVAVTPRHGCDIFAHGFPVLGVTTAGRTTWWACSCKSHAEPLPSSKYAGELGAHAAFTFKRQACSSGSVYPPGCSRPLNTSSVAAL